MKNKEYVDVINIVLRENSYIDIVQISSGLSALKFCFFSFLIWNAIVLSFKLWLYEIVNYDIDWLNYPLLVLIFSTTIIMLLSSNLTFWRCFSRKRMEKIIPTQSKFYFVSIHNWYANTIICISTIINVGFVYMIIFYNKYFYTLKTASDNYEVFSISKDETVLSFLDDTLTNFQHTVVLLQCIYVFTFIIFFAFFIAIFYIARSTKPVIFTGDINRSGNDIRNTIKPDGISIEKQNSEIITLDLLNQKLTLLFDAIVIFDYLCKDLIVFRNDVIQKIIVKEANNYKQIIYDSNLKKWVVH